MVMGGAAPSGPMAQCAHRFRWVPRTQVRVIASLFAVDALLLVVCAGLLRWI